MSAHVYLMIDQFSIDFGDMPPSAPMFLFSEEDFFLEEALDEYGEKYPSSYGYRTNRENAMKALSAYGYQNSLLEEAYRYVRSDTASAYKQHLVERAAEAAPRLTENEHVSRAERFLSQERSSRIDPLADYMAFLRDAIDPAASSRLFRGRIKPYPEWPELRKYYVMASEHYLRRDRTGLLDLQQLNSFAVRKPFSVKPEAARAAWIFGTLGQHGHPGELLELLELLWFRSALEVAQPGTQVTYDLEQVYEDPEVAEGLLDEVIDETFQRLVFYTKIYRSIAEHADGLRPGTSRALVRSLLGRLSDQLTADEKGRLLEDILVAVFRSGQAFEVVERRVNTGDEEIDLVIKNKSSDAFWAGLGSPLLLVECKNWKQKVGTRELRDFETKIRNHRPLVRVGFFIALNGYSSRARDELLRASREDYSLVLLDGADIARFAQSGIDVTEWLEEAICRIT